MSVRPDRVARGDLLVTHHQMFGTTVASIYLENERRRQAGGTIHPRATNPPLPFVHLKDQAGGRYTAGLLPCRRSKRCSERKAADDRKCRCAKCHHYRFGPHACSPETRGPHPPKNSDSLSKACACFETHAIRLLAHLPSHL